MTIPQPQMAISESPSPLNNPNLYEFNQYDPNAPPSSSPKDPIASEIDKANTSVGYLYYSRLRKSDFRVGVPRSFTVGYSLYPDWKELSSYWQQNPIRLPVCYGGHEILLHLPYTGESPTASHIRYKEDTMKLKPEEPKNTILQPKMAKPAPSAESSSILNNLNGDDLNQHDHNAPPSSSPKDPIDSKGDNISKAKSCKGCLYYSSRFKADSRNPLCVGLTQSLPSVPRYIVGESEMEASKEGRNLADFRYTCVGYSLYPDQKEQASHGQQNQTELPICFGLEILADRRVNTAESPAPSHIHNKEDGNGLPQRRTPKPTNSGGDDFFGRFTRNANLVANGVAKNVRRVGNQIKQGIDDVLYPYRRRPK